MSVKQTIMDFYKVAQSRDFSRNYQFRVIDISNKGESVFEQDELVYATTASLPGKAVNAVQVPYNGFNFKIPGTSQYPDSDNYPITFYLDSKATTRVKMETWLRETFNEFTTTGDLTLHDNSVITLANIDNNFNISRLYKLHGVFPVAANSVDYQMTGNGEVAIFTSGFAYQFMTREDPQPENNTIGKLSVDPIG